jgi:hypothetical protein
MSGGNEHLPPRPPTAEDWYYDSNGTATGPVTELDLQQLIADGRLTADTLVWTESLGEWTSARDVAALRRQIRK